MSQQLTGHPRVGSVDSVETHEPGPAGDATAVPCTSPGTLAPVPDEIDAVDLPVEGSLRPELVGRFLRNGPNPLPGEPSDH